MTFEEAVAIMQKKMWRLENHGLSQLCRQLPYGKKRILPVLQ